MASQLTIQDLVHPIYAKSVQEWQKWRYTYQGGMNFINYYLKQYSKRESAEEFKLRRELSYNPAFAREAVDEIKNSIFQRLVDITRIGGSSSYQGAIRGEGGGVDLQGRSMNNYLGTRILPELLTMARVGIFVDMPQLSGITLANDQNAHPYLYKYDAESIRSWRFDQYSDATEFSNLLLRDYVFKYDDETGLPIGEIQRYRRLWVEDGVVHVKFYAEGGSPYGGDSIDNDQENQEIVLNIPRIPFVTLELSQSLLLDVANYQIALLNLESSDLAYVLKCNFPFYVEQYDPRADSAFTRSPGMFAGGESADAQGAKTQELRTGLSAGRRYPMGMDAPSFIHPSPEPLRASMDKQEQMKLAIRQLVMLAVSNLVPNKMASAESKAADNQGLEAGLSYIGLELENAERRIATYWSAYEKGTKPATIFYPEKYELRSDDARLGEAKSLADLLEKVPSVTYKKQIAKRIATLLLRNKISNDDFDKTMKEIDEAPATTTDPDTIWGDIDRGICSAELGSQLRGYPEGTSDIAKEEHAQRLARIADSQMKQPTTVQQQPGGPAAGANLAARGVPDNSGEPFAEGSLEKAQSRDTTGKDTTNKGVRGKGMGAAGAVTNNRKQGAGK